MGDEQGSEAGSFKKRNRGKINVQKAHEAAERAGAQAGISRAYAALGYTFTANSDSSSLQNSNENH